MNPLRTAESCKATERKTGVCVCVCVREKINHPYHRERWMVNLRLSSFCRQMYHCIHTQRRKAQCHWPTKKCKSPLQPHPSPQVPLPSTLTIRRCPRLSPGTQSALLTHTSLKHGYLVGSAEARLYSMGGSFTCSSSPGPRGTCGPQTTL